MRFYRYVVVVLTLTALSIFNRTEAQSKLDVMLPIRGFAISAPLPLYVDSFVLFIENEIAPRHINTLLLRVDYNYQFKSHPELSDSIALSEGDVKKIVASCRRHDIKIIPQINMLGHQSWANRNGKLLAVYPQFDETPEVKMPDVYQWPNPDKLYCKSYCPLHPDLHRVLFDIIDELCDAYEADAFHAGMDEVFYIGSDNCPRCKGISKAKLFADEVARLHDHLSVSHRKLWIWGDRLIDGSATGIDMWEASMNDTYGAVDMIPKDVVICDWHYEKAFKTAAYFAGKGFNVVSCPWRDPAVATEQVQDMISLRKTSGKIERGHYRGVMQTVWSRPQVFINGFYQNTLDPETGDKTPWNCFRQLFDEINRVN